MTGPGGRDFGDTIRDYGLLLAVLAGWLIGGGLWLALFFGSQLAGTDLPGNPIFAVLSFLSGRIPWPGFGATVTVAAELLVVIGVGQMIWQRRRDRARGRTRVDGAARHMARRAELHRYTEPGVAQSATRLRPRGAGTDPAEHGVYLGDTVTSPRIALRSSWEDTVVVMAGTRRAKTTAQVIRQLIEAPGPTLATSLRRDVWDATVEMRRTRGQIWNFDPYQLIAETTPGWWFDPLRPIRTIDHARKLKDHFVTGTRDPGAKKSAYFDDEGEKLLAGLMLAAALNPKGRNLLNVHRWVFDPTVKEPVDILKDAGQPQVSEGINAIRQIASDKQKAGVYGVAQSLISCLDNPEVTRWVTPPADRGVPEFDPARFVRGRDTLYLHSKKGEGNISPLIDALTESVFDAALHRASRLPGGRLDPPLLGMLDEAGNTFKIKHLAEYYSYFGGSGLVLVTILQSFQQGVDIWGLVGMRKLLDAATVRVYGGGLLDPELLRGWSEMIGDYDELVSTINYDRHGHRSVSDTPRKERILPTSDLVAMPDKRAVAFVAGSRPVIIELQPWMDSRYAESIRASIAAHNPAGTDPDDDLDEPGDTEQPPHWLDDQKKW